MRQQPLIGYVLHQRPYRENRSLMIFFSQEFGIVHGVGQKNLPLFMPIHLLATGKSQLKNFSQSQPQISQKPLVGHGLYVGFYLNELLVKLLPVEENCANIWQNYQQMLINIHTIFHHQAENSRILLKWYLRQFEHLLIGELGYAIDFDDINPTLFYQYRWQQGFIECQNSPNFAHVVTGEQLINWQNLLKNSSLFATMTDDEFNFLLNQISPIYRQIIDNLLNHQPLKSRELWQQFTHFSK